MPVVNNPYRRAPRPAVAMVAADSAAAASINLQMGPQSQKRLTLNERTHQLQSNSHRKKLKAGDKQTLFGDRAFDPNKDCAKCKARLGERDLHRGHHPLCWNNRRTKGVISAAALESIQEEKRLKTHFSAPLADKDKFSSRHTTKEAQEAFFFHNN